MDSVAEMQPNAYKQHLIEQHEHTTPVYSWLCNTDYGPYITKLFKDISNDDDD